jgi:hypothetical protein
MTQPESQPAAIDCIFDNILAFMLPFFLSAAGGDANLGRATIQQLAESYNATTTTELELVGRILGFSTVAMDNLRLSMNPGMSDTKILRYRSNAVALSRAGEQCRKILEAVQASRQPAETPIAIPRPAIAAAPPVAKAATPDHSPNPPRARPIPTGIEAMKREARTMLAAFSSTGGASAAFPQTQDPAALIGAAVRDAIASSKRNAAA